MDTVSLLPLNCTKLKPKNPGYRLCRLALVMSFGARVCSSGPAAEPSVPAHPSGAQLSNMTIKIKLMTTLKYISVIRTT